ncbi:hypothetical protein ACFOET_12815 [Parapedobacter deserti]|uniref:Uncharacterized protein n=1 Tax=Parapedobacter deserti TaxID=1912957 RepID=A0ABV7JK79_9SPHI
MPVKQPQAGNYSSLAADTTNWIMLHHITSNGLLCTAFRRNFLPRFAAITVRHPV